MSEVNYTSTPTALDPEKPIAYVSRLALARLISGPEDAAQSLTLHRVEPNQLKAVALYLHNQSKAELRTALSDLVDALENNVDVTRALNFARDALAVQP